MTTKFKIGKKSGKSREFDFQAKSREKVVNFVESLKKVLNFGQIAYFDTKITNEDFFFQKNLKFGRAPRAQK